MKTDNDIIKALKECLTEPCNEQAYINAARNALDLINRQKAEIERLKYQVNRLKQYDEKRDVELHSRLTATTRAETIKEAVERLQDFLLTDCNTVIEDNRFTGDMLFGYEKHQVDDFIDNIIKIISDSEKYERVCN